MSDKMITYSNRADMLSIAAHLFCCGIPAFAALMSLISTAGATSLIAVEQLTDLAEAWHETAFYFSTAMLAVAVISFYLSRRADCVKEGHCSHEPCAPKKDKGYRRLALSFMLYAANVIVFLLG